MYKNLYPIPPMPREDVNKVEDEQFPVSGDVSESVKRRMFKFRDHRWYNPQGKLCNAFYEDGKCLKGRFCEYLHERYTVPNVNAKTLRSGRVVISPAIVLKPSVLQNGTGLVLRSGKVVGEAIPKITEHSLVDIKVGEVGDVLRSSSEFDSDKPVDRSDRQGSDHKEGAELQSVQQRSPADERPLLNLQEIGDIENAARLAEGRGKQQGERMWPLKWGGGVIGEPSPPHK